MHLIVTTFRGAVIKVEVANFCAAVDTLIDQDVDISGYWNGKPPLCVNISSSQVPLLILQFGGGGGGGGGMKGKGKMG